MRRTIIILLYPWLILEFLMFLGMKIVYYIYPKIIQTRSCTFEFKKKYDVFRIGVALNLDEVDHIVWSELIENLRMLISKFLLNHWVVNRSKRDYRWWTLRILYPNKEINFLSRVSDVIGSIIYVLPIRWKDSDIAVEYYRAIVLDSA